MKEMNESSNYESSYEKMSILAKRVYSNSEYNSNTSNKIKLSLT